MGKVNVSILKDKRKKKASTTCKRPIHQHTEAALRDALFEIRQNNMSVRKALWRTKNNTS